MSDPSRKIVAVALVLAPMLGAAATYWTVQVVTAFVVGLGLYLVARTARRFRSQLRSAVGRAAMPEIVMLPLAIAVGSHSERGSQLLLAGLAVSAWLRHRQRPPTLPLVLAIAAACVVGILGAPSPNLLISGACVVVIASSGRDPRAIISALVDGIGLYLIVNVAAYFALGARSPVSGVRSASTLETSSGLFGERIIFPFAQSVVTPPVLAAAFLVGVAPLALASRHHRASRLAGAACAVLVLIAANYRGTLLVSAALTAAVVLRPAWLIRCARPVALVALLVPFSYSALSGTVDQVVDVVANVAPSIDRETGQADALTGREVIWAETIERQGSFPVSRKLIGWGPSGHIASGTSQGYAYLFRGGFAQPLAAGSHNSALQQLIDGGWVGLVLLLAAVATTVGRLAKAGRRDPFALSAMGIALVMAVSGSTESVLAPGASPLGFALLLVVASVATPPGAIERSTLVPRTASFAIGAERPARRVSVSRSSSEGSPWSQSSKRSYATAAGHHPDVSEDVI